MKVLSFPHPGCRVKPSAPPPEPLKHKSGSAVNTVRTDFSFLRREHCLHWKRLRQEFPKRPESHQPAFSLQGTNRGYREPEHGTFRGKKFCRHGTQASAAGEVAGVPPACRRRPLRRIRRHRLFYTPCGRGVFFRPPCPYFLGLGGIKCQMSNQTIFTPENILLSGIAKMKTGGLKMSDRNKYSRLCEFSFQVQDGQAEFRSSSAKHSRAVPLWDRTEGGAFLIRFRGFRTFV